MSLDPDQFPGLAVAYRLSAVLLTAMDLGIPEAVAGGARTVSALAGAVGADAVMLRRLVRVLVAAEVLEQDDAGGLSLSAFAERMRTDDDGALATMVLGWQGLWEAYRAYGELPQALRTGAPPFATVFGQPFHDYLADHPDRQARYTAAVESTTDAFDLYARSYGFGRFATIADIGGGRGGLLRAICERHPGVHGLLVDLPSVLAGVEHELAADGSVDRFTIVAMDALAQVPPRADAYLFSTVLRCFGDDDAIRFLANARAASPTAAVLVIDFVMDQRPTLPLALADIHNLATYGGRDRDISEWTAVLGAAGYRIHERHDHPDNPIPILEALPAPS